jgi:hypothetical protein
VSLPTPNEAQPWHRWANVFIRALRPLLPDISTGVVDLGTGTTTQVSVSGMTRRQQVLLTPRSAAAPSGAAWISEVTDGSFTISHAAGAAGRSFAYLIV